MNLTDQELEDMAIPERNQVLDEWVAGVMIDIETIYELELDYGI